MPVDIAVGSVAAWDEEFRQPRGTDREEDVNPLICIRGSASPGHSYPMTPLHVRNTGDSPMEVTFSANPADAMTWLKVSPVEILPGESASIPLTLVVPSNAGPGESYVILTAGGVHFDVRFSVGVPPPRECLAAGYKPSPGNQPAGVLVADRSRGDRPRGLLGTEQAGRKSVNSLPVPETQCCNVTVKLIPGQGEMHARVRSSTSTERGKPA